ncbi:MAG: hypothetical protein ACK47B_22025 [Armatimonadota bacterium]
MRSAEATLVLLVASAAPTLAQEPEPEPEPSGATNQYDLFWESIRLRTADAAVVVRALGGDSFPESLQDLRREIKEVRRASKQIKMPAFYSFPHGFPTGIDGGIFLCTGTTLPSPPPSAPPPGYYRVLEHLVPEGIVAVVGIRADNTLLVRGTPSDIALFREVLTYVDVPCPSLRVRLTCNRVSLEGLTLDRETLRLAGFRQGLRLTAQVEPRVSPAGEVEAAVKGSIRVGGEAAPIDTRLRVRLGQAVRVVSTEVAG